MMPGIVLEKRSIPSLAMYLERQAGELRKREAEIDAEPDKPGRERRAGFAAGSANTMTMIAFTLRSLLP